MGDHSLIDNAHDDSESAIESVWHVLPGYRCNVYSSKSEQSEIIEVFEGGKLFRCTEDDVGADWIALDVGWIRKKRVDGILIVAKGDSLVGAFWRFQIICRDGAFVREGLELTTKHVFTESFGSIVESSERRFNGQGLARLHIGSGWISEYLNPLSGQSGQITQLIPMLAPLRYRIVLREGCVVRHDVELSSPIVRIIPYGEYVDIVDKKWTDHPAANCIPRLKLLDRSGWISLRVNRPAPDDHRIVELVGLSPNDKKMGVANTPDESELQQCPDSVVFSKAISNIVEGKIADDNVENKEKLLCIICMDDYRTAILVHEETGHVACCLKCSRILKARGDHCPVCRLPISSVVQLFWA